MQTTIHHNPRCSKSRASIKLLETNGIPFEVRLYLNDISKKSELKKLLRLLNFKHVRDLIRTKESSYQALNLKKIKNEDKFLDTMIANPILIKRPIIATDCVAKIGWPPESVLTSFI